MFKKNYCVGCKKWKWFCKVREIYFQPVHDTIKSQGALCRKCFSIIKRAK